MIGPARVAAFEILRAMRLGGTDLPAAIARFRTTLRDDRDRALAADIATGVQRHRGTLDFLIASMAKRSLEKLDTAVVDILRLSSYQLLHLTRVPAAAVVDDAVTLTRRAGKTSAAGFVNAVLRSLSRHRKTLPLPPRPEPGADRERALDYLTVVGSHPRWLMERWLDRIGFERTEAWTAFNNRPAPLTLRANTMETTAAALATELEARDFTVHPGTFAPDALLVDVGRLDECDLDRRLFLIQDEASQLVALLAGEDPGPLVLDTCAAPGGKTAALAAAAGAKGLVVAADLRERRVRLLRRTIEAAQASRVRIVRADASAGLPFGPIFSTVLVDAPCSGLGTLRRDPDIRWRRSAEDLAPLAATQLELLQQGASAVAPGGRLIYATCSTEPEENEDVASAFLARTPQFMPVDARLVHGRLPPAVVDDRGHLRTVPDQHGLEGFFGAVFVRKV